MGFNSGFKGLKTFCMRTVKTEFQFLGLCTTNLPTVLLSPSSDRKPEAATAVVVAPDDGHEDAGNVLSCI